MDKNIADVVNGIVEVMDYVLADQMGLIPPDQYDVYKREGRVYLTAAFDVMMIGRFLKHYESVDMVRVLRKAMADQGLGNLPVTWTKKTMRYVVLASGQLSLPRVAMFPGFGAKDTFRLGICLRGEVAPHADRLKNVIIGANQGAGKSNVLKLFVHQARMSGWQLYICDPDGHTFNPDAWNPIAAAPVASSPDDLQILIDRIYNVIANRASLYMKAAVAGVSPADIDAYNKNQSAPLPRIGLFVDEANSYLSNRKIFKALADLLRRGRKWGLHIFLAGHEWHKNVVLAELNDMLQTRIGLRTANEESSAAVLRSHRWGKWVMGKAVGRGVIRVDQYQPMQFYKIDEEMESEWLSKKIESPSPLSESEALLVKRSLEEAEGKMTIDLLTEWGMGQREARRLVESWESAGWLERDPYKGNARLVTPVLAGFADKATNLTKPTSPQIWRQSPDKAIQTPDMPLSGSVIG